MANPLVAPAIAEIAIITYRDVKNGSTQDNPVPHMPLPSQYVSVAVVYGLLGLVQGRGQRVASIAGWGFVVATLLNVFTPGGGIAQVNIAKKLTKKSPSQAKSTSTNTNAPGPGPGSPGASGVWHSILQIAKRPIPLPGLGW